jgi:hypothetical protein
MMLSFCEKKSDASVGHVRTPHKQLGVSISADEIKLNNLGL